MSCHEAAYDPQMLDDLLWWRDNDPDVGRRVVAMIEETLLAPNDGRGKPKRIGGFPGVWSRRISQEHRLFYIVDDDEIYFVSCRGHDTPRTKLAEIVEVA